MIWLVMTALVLGTLAIAAVLYAWLLHRRLQQVELLCLRNSQDVACFADSTVAIGRAVERALGQQPEGRAPVASRRWVLRDAQRRLAEGEPLTQIAARLQLGVEEQTLLAAQRANAA